MTSQPLVIDRLASSQLLLTAARRLQLRWSAAQPAAGREYVLRRIVGTVREQLQATARLSTGCTDYTTVDLAPLTAQVATTNWRSTVGARRSHAVPADCSRS